MAQSKELVLAEPTPIELLHRRNAGMIVIYSRLMRECVNIFYVEDERTGESATFNVADDEVWDTWNHAFAHPQANLSAYTQNQNGEGYGC